MAELPSKHGEGVRVAILPFRPVALADAKLLVETKFCESPGSDEAHVECGGASSKGTGAGPGSPSSDCSGVVSKQESSGLGSPEREWSLIIFKGIFVMVAV